ncbi:MAG: restriction endonuclease [Verrucomicrobiota bacterium]
MPDAATLTATSPFQQTWSLDLLQQLDWKRFEELTRMVITKGGYRTEVAVVSPNGAVSLLVFKDPQTRKPDAMIQCPAWQEIRVHEEPLRHFSETLQSKGLSQGTFITPGSFAPDATLFAHHHNIELIDGLAYLEMLYQLEPDETAYFLQLATAGEFAVPTCPTCGAKMEQRQTGAPRRGSAKKNLNFRKSETVDVKVQCNKLTIGKKADVQFMKEVHAMKITIRGRAVGNFTCNGTVTIEPTGTVVGMVAARAIQLIPDGILDGEMKILNAAEIVPVAEDPVETFWGCRSHPRCPSVLNLRESDAPPPPRAPDANAPFTSIPPSPSSNAAETAGETPATAPESSSHPRTDYSHSSPQYNPLEPNRDTHIPQTHISDETIPADRDTNSYYMDSRADTPMDDNRSTITPETADTGNMDRVSATPIPAVPQQQTQH